ncbi:MAG: hypothetical protein WC978_05650 [bacterium]
MRRATIKDEIRVRKKAKIKSMAGKMEFAKTADDLRHKDERLGLSPRVSIFMKGST